MDRAELMSCVIQKQAIHGVEAASKLPWKTRLTPGGCNRTNMSSLPYWIYYSSVG